MKIITKAKITALVSLFFGLVIAFFVWSFWKWLSGVINNNSIILLITGFLIFIGIMLGYISIGKILKKFM